MNALARFADYWEMLAKFGRTAAGQDGNEVSLRIKALFAATGAPRCSIAETSSTMSRLLIS